ncbi:MAG: hypothetical protein IKU15_05050 [Clostridia bacterium]|nr:hypothetical protein [Clostridia bacterium]
MKKEHIVFFKSETFRFYIKENIGLCVDIKDGIKFVFSECILKDATSDFDVAANENEIHIVCQSDKGAIFHLCYDGKSFKNICILESREKVYEFKNITLLMSKNHICLIYVIHTKDGYILVSQFLNDQKNAPRAIDYIDSSTFSACSDSLGNIVILYRNADVVLGTKKLCASKADFESFVPLDCGCELKNPVIISEEDDVFQIAGYATFDKFTNVLFLSKDIARNQCSISAVHLVSGDSLGLCLSKHEDTLYISWCENGLVMSANMTENKWSSPKKYIKGNDCENILYKIHSAAEVFNAYGFSRDSRIYLYHPYDILDFKDRIKKQPSVSPEDKDNKPSEYVLKSTYKRDLASLKKLLSGQNDIIMELFKKIAVLERTASDYNEIVEDIDKLDNLAMENAKKDIS